METQKQSKSEARHEKQKQKLLAKETKIEVDNSYKPDKNIKLKICDEANSRGYECILDNGTLLMFKQKDKEMVTKWLQDNYAKDEDGVLKIPFSYGFN